MALAGMAHIRKGQRVRATLEGRSGGVTFCKPGDVGKALAVDEQSIASMQWDSGDRFPTPLYDLERADAGTGPLKVDDRVRRTRPVLDGKGSELLAAGQLGTIIGVDTRVRVAVIFDQRKDTAADSSEPTKGMWMTHGLEPLDGDSNSPGSASNSPGGALGSRAEPQVEPEHDELLKVQVQSLLSGSEEQKATAADFIAAYARRPDGVSRLARQDGLLEGLVQLLQPEFFDGKEGALANAQWQALVSLKNLAADVETRRRIGEIQGAFRGIARLLQCDFPETTQLQAAQVLGNLSISLPANQQKIGEEPGALLALARLMEPGCASSLQGSAAAAMANLAISHPSNKELIGDLPTAITFLNQLLEPESDPEVQLQAAILLGTIAVGNAQNQERICAMPDTIRHLTNLLEAKNRTLLRLEAASTLKNLVAANYETQLRVGALPETLKALATLLERSSPQSLREEAAAALYNLAADCPVNRRHISETRGVLQGLAQLLDSESPSGAQEKSLLALQSLIGRPANGDALLREVPNALETLACLLKPGTAPAVQAKAIAVLTSLALGDSNMMSLIGDVPNVLADLLHLVESGTPRSLQEQAAGALTALKGSDRTKCCIEDQPVEEMVVSTEDTDAELSLAYLCGGISRAEAEKVVSNQGGQLRTESEVSTEAASSEQKEHRTTEQDPETEDQAHEAAKAKTKQQPESDAEWIDVEI